MPHDTKGAELQVGDTVLVPCVVKSISPNPDFCNMTVETVEPMHPGEHKTTITLNARQALKSA